MQRNHIAASISPTAPRPGATVLDALAAARPIAPTTPLKITTEEAAERMRNRPQTWRAAYCRDGHFHGITPTKLPSRRLQWDSNEVDALIAGQTVKADAAKIAAHFERKAADASKGPAHLRAKAEKRLTSGEGA